MGAKPVLYYVLARSHYASNNGFRVIGVTSTRGRIIYGRDESDTPTHIGANDLIHQFPDGTTEDHARNARARAELVREKMNGWVMEADRELINRRRVMRESILAAAKGKPLPDAS